MQVMVSSHTHVLRTTPKRLNSRGVEPSHFLSDNLSKEQAERSRQLNTSLNATAEAILSEAMEMKMRRYQVSDQIEVCAPVEEVYAIATNPEIVPSYAREIERIELVQRLDER